MAAWRGARRPGDETPVPGIKNKIKKKTSPRSGCSAPNFRMGGGAAAVSPVTEGHDDAITARYCTYVITYVTSAAAV